MSPHAIVADPTRKSRNTIEITNMVSIRRPDRQTKRPGVGRENFPPADEPETGHEQGSGDYSHNDCHAAQCYTSN